MTGVDLDFVRKGHESPLERDVKLAGEFPGMLGAEKIGSSDGANEKRVAGQDARRFPRLFHEH
jgi:hypothetical protein